MNQAVFAARNITDKLQKVMGSWETARFYWQTYILSRLEGIKPDIYVVSYPKCGRTWLRIMLQKYLESRGRSILHYHDRSLLGIVDGPIVKFEHDKGNWVPAPLKEKDMTFNRPKYSGKKVVFLVRDLRDVLVSSWYHLKYRENIFKGDLSAFVRDPLVGVEKVVAFHNMWMENRSIPEGFLLMTYEELHSNPHESFRKMLSFMGFEVDDKLVDTAVEESSFDRMKEMEMKGSMREPWMKPGTKNLGKSLKVRKGKVGGYREELGPEDVAYVDSVIEGRLSSLLPYGTEPVSAHHDPEQ
jgi:hypothetical protein